MSAPDFSRVLATAGQAPAPAPFIDQVEPIQSVSERAGHWFGRRVAELKEFAADPRVQAIGKAFLMTIPFVVANHLFPSIWARVGIFAAANFVARFLPQRIGIPVVKGASFGLGLTFAATGCQEVFRGSVGWGAWTLCSSALLLNNSGLIQDIGIVARPAWESLCHLCNRVYRSVMGNEAVSPQRANEEPHDAVISATVPATLNQEPS